MTALEATIKSIESWNKKIEFARRQNMSEKPSSSRMKDAIGVAWRGDDCALCDFAEPLAPEEVLICIYCPLGILHGRCEVTRTHEIGSEFHNPWMQINQAASWGRWLKHAYLLIGLLENTRRELELIDCQKEA